MTVTYIRHSGFLVELARVCLLFDYWQGELPAIPAGKKLIVLASHRHRDHFTPEVFSLADGSRDVTFVLSSDIRAGRGRADVIHVPPHTRIQVGQTGIETLRSTDEGVAFIVRAEGRTIYHAGDLNLWSWPGEDEEENARMETRYLRELDRIAGMRFDAAFVVLDPRQEEDFDRGMASFLTRCCADHVFPMHMWQKPAVIAAFRRKHPELSSALEDVEAPGQTFFLTD